MKLILIILKKSENDLFLALCVLIKSPVKIKKVSVRKRQNNIEERKETVRRQQSPKGPRRRHVTICENS